MTVELDEPPFTTFFRNGYQSWSQTDTAVIGRDSDPSCTPGVSALVRAIHHADPDPAQPGELRSEFVTVLDDTRTIGALAGDRHDTTLRAALRDGRPQLSVEAYLGGAVLAAGEQRHLHDVVRAPALEDWASTVPGGRVAAPFRVGWCSWYQWFERVTERQMLDTLAMAETWPFDVIQLDDGFQASIGDWLETNDRFPSGVGGMAAAIKAAGRTPGLWLSPFLVSPGSSVFRRHPGWVASDARGRPLVGLDVPHWGGPVYVLDTTMPEVIDHIERTAADLVAAGFPYLKIDFTYAPAVPGRFSDPSRTPAERVRAGMEAVRRGAGPEPFLLGCGLPLPAGIGIVDGMRIGPDVAPHWEVRDAIRGYEGVAAAVSNAHRNTTARDAFHRRLWLNDPDCVLLRPTDTDLSAEEIERWARTVGASGGMVTVSDDLALLGTDSRRLLAEVVDEARRQDAVWAGGRP